MSSRKKAVRRRKTVKRGGGVRPSNPPKDAITLTVILRAREGQDVLLEAELRALIGPTRKEDGCLTFDLYRSTDVPGVFLLHEVWSNRDAHTQHRNTPHFLRWNARKDPLIASREAGFWRQVR